MGRQYLKIESVILKRPEADVSRAERDFFPAFLSYSFSLLSLCTLLGALTDTGKEWCWESRLGTRVSAAGGVGVGGGPEPWVFALPASQRCMTGLNLFWAESLMGLIIPFFQSHRVKVSFKAAVNGPAYRRPACIPQPCLLSTFTILCQALAAWGTAMSKKRRLRALGQLVAERGQLGLHRMGDVAHQGELLLLLWHRTLLAPPRLFPGSGHSPSPL